MIAEVKNATMGVFCSAVNNGFKRSHLWPVISGFRSVAVFGNTCND